MICTCTCGVICSAELHGARVVGAAGNDVHVTESGNDEHAIVRVVSILQALCCKLHLALQMTPLT